MNILVYFLQKFLKICNKFTFFYQILDHIPGKFCIFSSLGYHHLADQIKEKTFKYYIMAFPEKLHSTPKITLSSIRGDFMIGIYAEQGVIMSLASNW